MIIDYPRYLKISSDYETVEETQSKLRKHKIFHKEYDPAIDNCKS